MIEVSFREKIVALQEEWLKDPYNTKRTEDFWPVMDSISDELAVKWGERSVNIKNSQGMHNTEEWLSACNILHTYKQLDKDKKKLTPGQKRKLIFHIIRNWDDLEMDHFC